MIKHFYFQSTQVIKHFYIQSTLVIKHFLFPIYASDKTFLLTIYASDKTFLLTIYASDKTFMHVVSKKTTIKNPFSLFSEWMCYYKYCVVSNLPQLCNIIESVSSISHFNNLLSNFLVVINKQVCDFDALVSPYNNGSNQLWMSFYFFILHH